MIKLPDWRFLSFEALRSVKPEASSFSDLNFPSCPALRPLGFVDVWLSDPLDLSIFGPLIFQIYRFSALRCLESTDFSQQVRYT